MKKKIIITLALFSLFFLTCNLYIVFSIQRGTSTLDNLIKLHQVEIMREHLLIQLKRVQSDLQFKNTRYARAAATMVDHVRAMDNLMDGCFDCHHSESVTLKLRGLSDNIEQYKDAVSRVLTIRADVARLEAEEDAAFVIGNNLLDKTNEMIAIANKNLKIKTEHTLRNVDFSKKVLIFLIAIIPFVAAILAFIFTRSLTGPVNVLLEATRRIKDVDLDYRIEEKLTDEFAELAAAFNEMAGSLQQQCQNMQRAEQLTVYGEMAAGLAHEIKTPLAGIKGVMKLLARDETVSTENRRLLDMVLSEIQRIEALMKDLLSYARPPKSNFMLINMNDVIETTTSLLPKYPTFAREGVAAIHLVKAYDPALPEVETDPLQQQQVLLNLFLNAADAMPEGGVLTVKTGYAPGSDRIQIIVADTGTGIEDAGSENIFKPFFTTKPKGTGLGLPTAKRLIEQHGGAIRVRNNPGAGVAFVMDIPLKQRPKE